MTKILIEVSGGRVTAVYSSDPKAAVVVVDRDTRETDLLETKAWRRADNGDLQTLPEAVQPR